MKVLVLLATYNGECYLREQLDSILSQVNVDVDILARDDGSLDKTVEILREYSNNYKNKVTFIAGNNLGAGKNFLSLIYIARTRNKEYDYFALSDQDDVWLPNKLYAAISRCGNANKSIAPSLYFGQYRMVDKNLQGIQAEREKKAPKMTLGHALVDNVATGCTMVFNRSLLLELCEYSPDFITMHDDWIYKVCVALGGSLFYDSVPYILYRQHGRNVIGGLSDNFIKKWSLRLKKIFKKSTNIRLRVATELYRGYSVKLPIKNKLLLYEVVNYKKGLNRFRLFFNRELCGENLDATLRVKFLILFSKY